MYFSVLSELAFICTVFLSRNVVILAVSLMFPYKREVWLAIKPYSTNFLFIFHFSICCNVVFSYSVCVSLVLICASDLISLKRSCCFYLNYANIQYDSTYCSLSIVDISLSPMYNCKIYFFSNIF